MGMVAFVVVDDEDEDAGAGNHGTTLQMRC